jgi:filamentous hemagglutinin family protein
MSCTSISRFPPSFEEGTMSRHDSKAGWVHLNVTIQTLKPPARGLEFRVERQRTIVMKECKTGRSDHRAALPGSESGLAWPPCHRRFGPSQASFRGTLVAVLALAWCGLGPFESRANPLNPTVSQGSANFQTAGSQLTVTAANNTLINWSSFNIGAGQTTTFVQPSSSSLVWNQINDSNPSQLNGNLNANGYVVLQNQKGFTVGGSAVINANGLVMTTTAAAAPNLSAGGPFSFTLPPPSASIVNYGKINASTFLIAYNIDNEGTIDATKTGANVGLYAGGTVLVSTRSDGRGLSAQVTLPAGSVNNQGQVVADVSSLGLEAIVNKHGFSQASAAQIINGTVQLTPNSSAAGDAITLGPNSTISAKGGEIDLLTSGSVTFKSDYFNVSSPGGTLALAAYNLEVDGSFAPLMNGGFTQINLLADNDVQFDTFWTLTDPGVSALFSVTAQNNIIFLDGTGIGAVLQDANGNATTHNDWSISLAAGLELTSSASRQSGRDGVYLLGDAYLQTQDGDLNVWAANEVQINCAGNYVGNGIPITLLNGTTVNDVLNSGPATGTDNNGNEVGNGITTQNGGNVKVTTLYGDVNAGGNYYGYEFGLVKAPHYDDYAGDFFDQLYGQGGISTSAGGNVSINAGGNVSSYVPLAGDWSESQHCGGSGAYGSQAGNVTIVAGGSVSGSYVLANGAGSITAQQGNIGSATTAGDSFALNLVKGSWNVSAPNGSIYLQDARNPNGNFDNSPETAKNPGAFHSFDYDPMASVTLTAGDAVVITGLDAPHDPNDSTTLTMPFLFPPTLKVTAGAGGFTLDQNVILFPSAYGNLQITTLDGGSFQGNGFILEMSDSAARQYNPAVTGQFGPDDHAPTSLELNNSTPVTISVSGDMDNVTLYTVKQTQITVGGNAFNANVFAENLHASDVTSVNVAGSITYSPSFVFASLSQPIASVDVQVSSSWDTIFSLLVNPAKTSALALTGNESLATLENDINNLRLFPGTDSSNPFNASAYSAGANPGFVYDSASMQLAYKGQMSAAVLSELTGTLEIIQGDPHTGMPVLVKGQTSLGQDPTKYYFATTTVTFVPASVIKTLYAESQSAVAPGGAAQLGIQVDGPGVLNVSAASMDLGSSDGIVSWGIGHGGGSYLNDLTPYEQGAAVNVNVGGNLTMLSSTIASIFGGDVTVNCGGALTLSEGYFTLPQSSGAPCFGIFTSGHSDVSVTAVGDIDVGNSRIAAFNGGNVFVESTDGDVNAGYGANTVLNVPDVYKDPTTGELVAGDMGGSYDHVNYPLPYGSGILAIAPTADFSWSTKPVPGNITVKTPKGNITSSTGGIEQFALDGDISAGPTITLTAGTPASGHTPAIHGNIDLGAGGVIGGTVNLTAQGNISGLIVSHQDANIVAAQNVSATVLAGGSANVSAVGSIVGTIAGIGGVSASAGSITASLLGQNVSANGAAAQSTLGTSAAATSTSQAAAQASTAQAQQEVASNDASQQDDTKKKGKSRPVLSRRVGRVTVILPKPN